MSHSNPMSAHADRHPAASSAGWEQRDLFVQATSSFISARGATDGSSAGLRGVQRDKQAAMGWSSVEPRKGLCSGPTRYASDRAVSDLHTPAVEKPTAR